MKRTHLVGILGIVACSFTWMYQAKAGRKSTQLVLISDSANGGYAKGALGSVRNSAESNAYIGCNVVANNDGHPGVVECFARNAAGVTRSCVFSNVDNSASGAPFAGDGWLQFEWDTSGSCDYVYAESGSLWEPKGP